MFIENVEILCKKRGLSFNGLTKELGLSPGAVTRWKAGGLPQRDTLRKIADYFDVTIEALLGEPSTVNVTTKFDTPSRYPPKVIHPREQSLIDALDERIRLTDELYKVIAEKNKIIADKDTIIDFLKARIVVLEKPKILEMQGVKPIPP